MLFSLLRLFLLLDYTPKIGATTGMPGLRSHHSKCTIRVYLGVRTCELFLCFAPFVFLGSIVFTSLFSLFYVTREFTRFLHRGWAHNSKVGMNSAIQPINHYLMIRVNSLILSRLVDLGLSIIILSTLLYWTTRARALNRCTCMYSEHEKVDVLWNFDEASTTSLQLA